MRFTLGAALTITCLWLLARRVDSTELFRSLSATDLSWATVALVAYAAGYAVRIERWRQMLAYENPRLRWMACAGPFFAGYAANNLLPLRAGDVIRAFAFRRDLGATPGATVATLIIERLLDLLALLCLFGLALIYFGRSASPLLGGGVFTILLASILTILILKFPDVTFRLALSCAGLLRRISPKLGERVESEIHVGFAAVRKILSRQSSLRLLSLTTIIWAIEFLIFWFVALAIPMLSHPISSLLALPVGTLATLIPSTPGFVGTFEYPIVVAMTSTGNSAAAATAYALVVHAILAVPSVLLGTPYLISHHLRARVDVAAP
ncbi:flippase-like domain-containing protein [Steroidobacter sp. S1-65]|uniref:Flippase-like domain-containing protein n=1 Tax=Steroidobacter gossypii TaxID=2805490 RepID=A0ABS1WZW1_9GAMM|nr:flippase-like domain-containing protein [Steroidobacter gossypii]